MQIYDIYSIKAIYCEKESTFILHIFISCNINYTFAFEFAQIEKMNRKVIHLQINEMHYYFGSLRALTKQFSGESIGIEYGRLRNYGLSENKPYVNTKCIIRKGILKTIEGGRGQNAEKLKK